MRIKPDMTSLFIGNNQIFLDEADLPLKLGG